MSDEEHGDEQETPAAEPDEVPYPPPTMDTDWTRDDSRPASFP